MRNILVILLMMFVGFGQSLAQSNEKELLKKALSKLTLEEKPKIGESFYAKYSMRVRYQDQFVPVQTVNIEMKANHSQSHFISDDIEYYKDEKDAFAIIKKQARLIWTNPNYGMPSKNVLEQQLALNAKLFEDASITKIKESPKQKGVVLYKLVPKSKIAEAYHIQYVLLEVNLKSLEVQRMSTYLTEESVYKTVDIVYSKVAKNIKLALNRPVRQLIFNSKNQLRPRYKGLKLIDTRSHAPK